MDQMGVPWVIGLLIPVLSIKVSIFLIHNIFFYINKISAKLETKIF